jgi:large subunit ribosomal protein L18
MHSPTPQAKVFAVLKGALDAGLQIPHGKDILPSEGRLKGEHIAQYAVKLKSSDEDTYKARFSTYVKRGLLPEQLPEHFNQIRQTIVEKNGG